MIKQLGYFFIILIGLGASMFIIGQVASDITQKMIDQSIAEYKAEVAGEKAKLRADSTQFTRIAIRDSKGQDIVNITSYEPFDTVGILPQSPTIRSDYYQVVQKGIAKKDPVTKKITFTHKKWLIYKDGVVVKEYNY